MIYAVQTFSALRDGPRVTQVPTYEAAERMLQSMLKQPDIYEVHIVVAKEGSD